MMDSGQAEDHVPRMPGRFLLLSIGRGMQLSLHGRRTEVPSAVLGLRSRPYLPGERPAGLLPNDELEGPK